MGNKSENNFKSYLMVGGIIFFSVCCIIYAVYPFLGESSLGISHLIAGIIGLGGIYVVVMLFSMKCSECGRIGAMITIDSVVIDKETINVKKRANDYDAKGKKIGDHEVYVQGTRTHTRDVDQCKYCGYKRTVTRHKDLI